MFLDKFLEKVYFDKKSQQTTKALKNIQHAGLKPQHHFRIQSTLDTSNFKGLGKICRVISSLR